MTPKKKLCIYRIVECNHLSIAKKRLFEKKAVKLIVVHLTTYN